MKKLFLIIALLFSAGNAFSQYYPEGPTFVKLDKFHTLDSAYLKCTYRFTHVQDSLNAGTTRKVDVQTLLVGKNVSKYFSQYMVDYCMRAMKMKTGYGRIEEGACGFEIYKNYPDKKMTVTDLGGWFDDNGNVLYEEETPNLKWEIKSDTLTILSYTCQKATTTFRGRAYEAWFSTDIPTNNGPWKFGGLPGLILKVSDQKQSFVFECIGMEKLKKTEPIKFYDLRYTKVSRKGLDKLYRRFLDDAIGYIIVNTRIGNQFGTEHSPKLPYNPIELE
jgi:GLPGLI family protein